MKLNREAWITRYAEAMRPRFAAHNLRIHGQIRVGMAPLSPSKRGLCFHKVMSVAGVNEIFVSAHENDAVEIGHVLVHELLHAVLPEGTKHKPAFKAAAARLGLVPHPIKSYRATDASPELRDYLKRLSDDLTALVGPLPPALVKILPKPPRPRLSKIKAYCAECKTVIYLSVTAVARGMPLCGNDDCSAYGEPFEEDGV